MERRAAPPPLDPPVAVPVRPAPPARLRREPGWRSLDILRAAALVMGLYLTLRLLWVSHQLLLIAFLGVLFGLAVASGTDYLERLRIPRYLGASLIVLGVVGALYGMGMWAAPTLREQSAELQRTLPGALDRIENWLERQRSGMLGQLIPDGAVDRAEKAAGGAAPAPGRPAQSGAQAPPQARPGQSGGAAESPDAGGTLSELPKTLTGQLGSVTRYLFSFLSSTVAVLGGIILILFIAIYVGAEPGMYKRGMLHLVPHAARPRAREVLTAIGMTLRRWLVSQLIAMVVIGVVTTITLKLLGVKAALSLGIIAGLMEFIPIAGPFLAAVPAVAMGFLDSPQKALFVAIAYIAIQQLENHVLIPMLMREGLDLPPLVTILGLALMGIVFGFLGMLVAVPLLAAIVVAIKLLYVEDVVGDDVETVLDSA
ncbi:MAG TPA: AI-2E family transporter [Thermoanaerobaculia bacterium]